MKAGIEGSNKIRKEGRGTKNERRKEKSGSQEGSAKSRMT